MKLKRFWLFFNSCQIFHHCHFFAVSVQAIFSFVNNLKWKNQNSGKFDTLVFFICNFTKISALVSHWNIRELSAMLIFDFSDRTTKKQAMWVLTFALQLSSALSIVFLWVHWVPFSASRAKWFPKWTGNSAPRNLN